MKQNIYGMTTKDLEEYFISINDKKFRAVQVYEFLYKKRYNNVDEFSNIGNNIKERLKEDFSFDKIHLVTKQEDEGVKKYLFKLKDNEYIESVLMYHDYGISLCISSQIGCNMGCSFCQSGRLKKVRNLESHEMVEQILLVEEDIKTRITHVVIMGIGEPFDNYDNLIKFIKIVNNPKGINLGTRHITVSTCGLVDKIKKFANEEGQVNLAISLHAPTDELRKKIMKIAKVYSIKELMDAIKYYINKTNRRVTFEYILLENVNDSDNCAYELARLLKGMNAYVNLIPYNETDNITYKRTKDVQIKRFYDILKKEGITVTKRKEFGSKVDAACGQLRSNYNK